MTSLVWAGTSGHTTTTVPTARELAGRAVLEHLATAYYPKWLKANPNLGALVDAYLRDTGRRPTDLELGANRYGRALTLTKDIERG